MVDGHGTLRLAAHAASSHPHHGAASGAQRARELLTRCLALWHPEAIRPCLQQAPDVDHGQLCGCHDGVETVPGER